MFTYQKATFMDFIEHTGSFYIKTGLLIVFLLGYFFVSRKDNLKLTLYYLLYSYGIAMLLLSVSITHVFPGYPDTISDLENKKMLLYHLHKNNEALVQITETMRDIGFLTFIFLMIILEKVIKPLKFEKSSK